MGSHYALEFSYQEPICDRNLWASIIEKED